MTGNPYNVLFLCTGNSARSLIAEAIMNREAAGRFKTFSAGLEPGPAPHPYTLDLLEGLHHDTQAALSKSRDAFAGPDAPRMDFVSTLCDSTADEECPVWPGQPMTAPWGMSDPVAVEGSEAVRRAAFAEAYRMLRSCISIFVSLPFASLDRMALQCTLDDIGKTTAEAD